MKLKHKYLKEKRPKTTSPDMVYKLLKDIKDETQEMFIVLCLDNKKKVISKNIVFIGTLDSTIIHPREIFKIAILNSSSCLILAHNHPSGDPNPSDEDIKITNQLKEVGEIMGIPIIDHIIVGTNSYYSFSKERW